MIKILTVFGTRPEVIKITPVINEMKKYPKNFQVVNCVTAQHREMIDPLLRLFNIKPDFDLNLMRENQSLEYLTTNVLFKISKIIDDIKPDYLIVQGDTTSAMVASLAAFYKKIKIAHIEAGLRSWDKLQPYPEEVNRRIIDSVSDLFFVHTEEAKNNLLKEGVLGRKIKITGNTVLDALLNVAGKSKNFNNQALNKINFNKKKIILVTSHRRESWGKPLINICEAIKTIASRFQDDVLVVFPVHLNPNVRLVVKPILKKQKNIILLDPLDYEPFVHLMKKAYLILTDSGGIQEEAPSLHVPVLVTRNKTERPEVIKAGAAELVGRNKKNIIKSVTTLLIDKNKYKRMTNIKNPYGDGKASLRIVKYIAKYHTSDAQE